MTQEEKQLLLQDLCTRLPYNVKACESPDYPPITIVAFDGDRFIDGDGWEHEVGTFKPYLRPMSSMTEEEVKEYKAFHCVAYEHTHFYPQFCTVKNELNMFDWLNAHHFDYRGLIGKGLALEAPEGMYDN